MQAVTKEPRHGCSGLEQMPAAEIAGLEIVDRHRWKRILRFHAVDQHTSVRRIFEVPGSSDGRRRTPR